MTDTLIQELSKWQHVIDSQIERRGEAALLRRTTEALLHAMDDAKGYKTNWDVCELKRKAEENQREILGDKPRYADDYGKVWHHKYLTQEQIEDIQKCMNKEVSQEQIVKIADLLETRHLLITQRERE
jgi:hypothetical protein